MFMSPSQSSETEIKHEEQFTGLKDKNGKEIYEGDKIMMYGDRTDAFVSKVFFSERFASFEIATTGNSVGFYHKSDIEVIGNIHESPELTNANK